jgi:hypothetical protein
MSAAVEQIGTCSKKVRGMAQKSLAMIEAMRTLVEAAQPITGRGVGYKLFVARLIASMATNDMQRVYRLLKEARERGLIPWEWIGWAPGTIPTTTPTRYPGPTAATSGTSNRTAWRSGPRRAPSAACSSPCLTDTRSASA